MAAKDKRLITGILVGSILVNVVAAIYAGRKIYNRYQSNEVSTPAYYLDRDKLFEVLPKDSNAIVFLGNSLTQYFELAEILQNPNIKNRGIHGDMITGVLKRLSPIIAIQPKKIFIEIGINDLEQKVSEELLLSHYQKLIDTLKVSCPQTEIHVQSLLPVANSSQRLPGYCSPEMNKKVGLFNTRLQQLAEAKQCRYIDIHSQLVLNDELNPTYSVDGVHLSGEGYLAWAKAIKPYVND